MMTRPQVSLVRWAAACPSRQLRRCSQVETLVKSQDVRLSEKIGMPPTLVFPMWHTYHAIHPKQRSA
jgi:hypothetical protein